MKKIFAFVMLIAFAAACDKDDDVKLSADAALVAPANGWVLQSITYDDPDDTPDAGPVDFLALGLFEACEMDDSFVFKSDKTVTVLANAKCEDESDSESGTWSLNSDQTTLTITTTEDGDTTTITISKLTVDGTNIKGETTLFVGDEGSLTVKVTFKKK